jgi:hypothetical protein
MASGPIYFSATTKSIPVDDLNNRLKALGRKEIITSIKSHPFAGMYLDGALEALKEAFGGSQQLLLAEGGRSDESALFSGVPKAETVRV